MRSALGGVGAVLLACAIAALGGCRGLGVAAKALGVGSKVPAQHRLEARPTLILVDDPHRQLGQPALRGVVARNIEHHLRENQAWVAPGTDKNVEQPPYVVPQEKLSAYAADLGNEFATMPVDQVARELGAEQVVYVSVLSAALGPYTGVVRPSAAADVKVLDAVQGVRLFPTSDKYAGDTSPPGFIVRVQMTAMDMPRGSRGAEAVLREQLAAELGRKVSTLFYKHSKPEPGHTIRNY